jgi:UDP-3-O-[3-hydroxymyristoyl] glucosamine N-acyltransferase
MAVDPRFFGPAAPQCLAAIAAAAGAAPPDADLLLDGLAPLEAAGPRDLSFLDNRRYADALARTRAGAVIVHPEMADRVPPGTMPLATPEPYAGWARAAALFYPAPPPTPGIHPTAVVALGAQVDPSAEVGPHAVVQEGAEIGARCRIGPGAVIGHAVALGPDCRIGAHASLSHALLGARVYVYPGARIGQDGFGFAATASGFVTVPQLGRVILGDDVEVGANTTIDRGALRDTVLGAGTRLDNLVQIGHGVRLGRGCVVVAQVGVAGSTDIGDFVRIGGQAAIAGHLRVGRGAQIGAQAGVMSEVADGAVLVGSPAQPRQLFFRQVALLKRLASDHIETRAPSRIERQPRER